MFKSISARDHRHDHLNSPARRSVVAYCFCSLAHSYWLRFQTASFSNEFIFSRCWNASNKHDMSLLTVQMIRLIMNNKCESICTGAGLLFYCNDESNLRAITNLMKWIEGDTAARWLHYYMSGPLHHYIFKRYIHPLGNHRHFFYQFACSIHPLPFHLFSHMRSLDFNRRAWRWIQFTVHHTDYAACSPLA